MLNRTKRALQQRCVQLALQAQQLAGQGRGAEALARYEEAASIARRLAEADPGDHRPLGEYVGMLFSLSQLYAGTGRDGACLTALVDCERIYRDLGARRILDARLPLAKVKARRIIAEIGLGLGVSAVLDADEAVSLYRELFAADDSDELALALADALLYSSEATSLFGDPDLTAAAAHGAMRLYLSRQDAPGFAANSLGVAAAIASASHAVAGRLDLALEADDARILAARMDAASGTAPGRRLLATAVALRGLHLQATGDPGRQEEAAACLAEAASLDAAEVRNAARFWKERRTEHEEHRTVTLAQALETAARVLGREHVPEDLATDLTRPAADGVLQCPSDRCRPGLAVGYASRLARAAIGLLPVAPGEGQRAGLEAHYLFVIGSRVQSWDDREFADWGVLWTRLLLELGRALATAATDPQRSYLMALDLVKIQTRIVEKLLPLVYGGAAPAPGYGEPGLGDLLRDSLAHDADMLTRNNDHADAQTLRKMAASIPR
jgi:tetratricopeptide (TPR) repeat protein